MHFKSSTTCQSRDLPGHRGLPAARLAFLLNVVSRHGFDVRKRLFMIPPTLALRLRKMAGLGPSDARVLI